MKDYRPLDETEQTAVAEVCRVLRPKGLIPCTACNGKAHECIGCGKCETACPQHLPLRQYPKDEMMEYCRLPRGEERLSTLGLGLCGRSRRTHTASNRISIRRCDLL